MDGQQTLNVLVVCHMARPSQVTMIQLVAAECCCAADYESSVHQLAESHVEHSNLKHSGAERMLLLS
jgi:hypothetical protein